jgi:hypothetical protein
MPRVLFTDQDYPDVALERSLLDAAGINSWRSITRPKTNSPPPATNSMRS